MDQLLMVVIRKKSETRKTFTNMITLIRQHLMSYVSLMEFIKDKYYDWRKVFDVQVAFCPDVETGIYP